MSDVYYRIYNGKDDLLPTLACMQDFDEPDYDQRRFLTEEKFESEAKAQEWLDSHGRLSWLTYWIQVDPVTLNPLGGVCCAHFIDDKPTDGHWLMVRAV